METTGFWCETLQVGDKVIVKSTGHYDTPRVTTITRTTRTQVFLKDGPHDHERAFWKDCGYQVKKATSLPRRLFKCTDETERAVVHQQKIVAIVDAARRLGERVVQQALTQAHVHELYEYFVRMGIIDETSK
ncbi:MAG TPA: hypothetical protein VI542_33110 [Candidatus Tectomicrobia bacterium]